MGQQQYIPPAAAAAAPLFACEKTNAEKICSRDIFPPEARRIARGVGWRRERVGSKKAVSGCSRGRPSAGCRGPFYLQGVRAWICTVMVKK